jgi:hypothetical protein
MALAGASDLLIEWWPRLRFCLHCQAPFLPSHGRQQYDDPKCSQAARYARFKPTRDTKAEYQRRKLRGVQGDDYKRRRRQRRTRRRT